MIKEKLSITKEILEMYPSTRGDGQTGNFLNIVSRVVYNDIIDFNEFIPETWCRARRKVLEMHPHLDHRTDKTKQFEEIVKSEVA